MRRIKESLLVLFASGLILFSSGCATWSNYVSDTRQFQDMMKGDVPALRKEVSGYLVNTGEEIKNYPTTFRKDVHTFFYFPNDWDRFSKP